MKESERVSEAVELKDSERGRRVELILGQVGETKEWWREGKVVVNGVKIMCILRRDDDDETASAELPQGTHIEYAGFIVLSSERCVISAELQTPNFLVPKNIQKAP